MKRQKRYVNDFDIGTTDTIVPMQRISQQPRFENTLEAQVQSGDTLQAIALRFHCTVADIKRLNKIDKDNEIFARKIIKVPITPHSILCQTLPTVHKSGQNSPKHNGVNNSISSSSGNILEDNALKEKLLVAAVNSSNGHSPVLSTADTINDIILQSKRINNLYRDDDDVEGPSSSSATSPLLDSLIDDTLSHLRPIPGPSKNSLDCSGSDCDMSWICLLILILALCFAIPLIYVFYVGGHPERFHHNAI